ncbi:signal peptidase I [Candidatus Pacearchaeota archaeon]|nr:signal peptidase I [Candidatus Pacearchaeota archaeon]
MKNSKKRFKEFLKKFWFVVWKDESLKGWLISILFLFVVIKLIFFPLLNLVTGTVLPLAIVESCSMYHEGTLFSDFDSWYESHDDKYNNFMINQLDFQEFPFKRGLNKGDILFIVGAKPEKLEKGDIIIFEASQSNPIIHRIIEINENEGEYIFSTIGDNNDGQLTFEKEISENKIVGKAVFRVSPYLGWVKLIFFEGNKPISEKGFCDEN